MSVPTDEVRVERRLERAMSRAIQDFRMIEEGDRILVRGFFGPARQLQP